MQSIYPTPEEFELAGTCIEQVVGGNNNLALVSKWNNVSIHFIMEALKHYYQPLKHEHALNHGYNSENQIKDFPIIYRE